MGLSIKLKLLLQLTLRSQSVAINTGEYWWQLEENQSIMVKKVTNLLAGTKTSGLLFNKKPEIQIWNSFEAQCMHYMQLACLLCALKNGRRGRAVVIPMYCLKPYLSQNVH